MIWLRYLSEVLAVCVVDDNTGPFRQKLKPVSGWNPTHIQPGK